VGDPALLGAPLSRHLDSSPLFVTLIRHLDSSPLFVTLIRHLAHHRATRSGFLVREPASIFGEPTAAETTETAHHSPACEKLCASPSAKASGVDNLVTTRRRHWSTITSGGLPESGRFATLNPAASSLQRVRMPRRVSYVLVHQSRVGAR